MHEFSDGRLQLLGIKLWDNALILNHTLIKMAEIYGADQFRIVAIKRHNHTIIPRGNDELKYGDLVLSSPDLLLFRMFSPYVVKNNLKSKYSNCRSFQNRYKNSLSAGKN